MTPRAWVQRLCALACFGAVAGAAGGCSLFGGSIQFTNVSDTWLNVRFYSGEPAEPGVETTELVSRRVYQVAPGASARFSANRRLVHIQVETISPTWDPHGTQYWLELMTHPPVHIVATGKSAKLDFQAGSGEVAIIPERERKAGRFEYVDAEKRRAEPAAPPPKSEEQTVAAPTPST